MECEVTDFSLEAIATSGQVFTWSRLGRSTWRIASGARLCVASQEGGHLMLERQDGGEPAAADRAYWRHYLALDDDYPAMLAELRAWGAKPEEAMVAGTGIRVLHQAWWDAAVSFVISQNSNIPRIQHAMDLLMGMGEPAGTVPSPARLAEALGDPATRASLRLGYREPYLRELARRAADGWEPLCLSRPFAPLEAQMRQLQELPGVGPKVASCVCLYGLGYLESVPRDTWIKRAERDFQVEWHPVLGGVQQQLVFAWARRGGLGAGREP